MTIIKHVKSTKATTVGIITPTSEIEETASLTPPEEGVTAKREREREKEKVENNFLLNLLVVGRALEEECVFPIKTKQEEYT